MLSFWAFSSVCVWKHRPKQFFCFKNFDSVLTLCILPVSSMTALWWRRPLFSSTKETPHSVSWIIFRLYMTAFLQSCVRDTSSLLNFSAVSFHVFQILAKTAFSSWRRCVRWMPTRRQKNVVHKKAHCSESNVLWNSFTTNWNRCSFP